MLAVVAATLCQAYPLIAQDRGVVVRDSAGIQIIENVTPAWTPTNTRYLNMLPTLTLGSASWPVKERFRWVRSAVRLSDGSIVVADAGKGELRRFDFTGRLVRRIGARGRETGQFFEVSEVFRLPGDSLQVWDQTLKRLTTFSPEGNGILTVNVDHPGHIVDGVTVGWALIPRGPVVAGEMLAVDYTGWRGFHTGTYSDSMNVSRFSSAGQLVRITSLVAGESYVYQSKTSRSRFYGMKPLTVWASIAPGVRSMLYTDGVHYEVREYDLEGKLLRIIRVHRMPSPVSDQDIAAFRDHGFEQPWPKTSSGAAPSREDQAFHAELLKWVSFPKTLPAFTTLMTETNGNIWAREYGDTMAVQHWDAFDRSGRLVGVVDFPARIDVLEIGADYVLGRFRGNDSLETVRLYRFAH